MGEDTAGVERSALRLWWGREQAGCIACPSCGGSLPRSRGAIPAGYLFAGRQLDRPLPGGSLYECPDCALGFRHPRPSAADLAPLYAQGSLSAWNGDGDARRDWSLAARWIHEAVPRGGRVLDAGCFDGAFLAYLGGGYRRYGIELHPGARAAARRRGVEIVARDIEYLHRLGPYDCVVATDMIEHVHDPLAFLAAARTALRPGGCIVIASGNTDSMTWRLMGPRYWYCAIAEHISFINPRWCRSAAAALELQITREARFAHVDARWPKRLKQILVNGGYRAAPRLWAALRRRGLGGPEARRCPQLADHPPSWVTAKDHLIVMFQSSPR